MRCISQSLYIAIFVGAIVSADAQTNLYPSSGNVGIGTTTPVTPLDIVGDLTVRADSGGQGVRVYGRTADNFTWAPLAITSSGTTYMGGIYYTPGAIQLTAGSNLTNVMTWLPNGNVGIGTVTPISVLDVVGDITARADSGGQALRVFGRSADDFTWGCLAYNHAGTAYSGGIYFTPSSVVLAAGTSLNQVMTWLPNGNVGIDTSNPSYPLSVNGTIQAKEVIVNTGWSDYVFEKGYRLAPLAEVERDIQTTKHLPGIPSAEEVAAHGVNLGQVQAQLLAKIEELTLHEIQQEKRLNEQAKQIKRLEDEIHDRELTHRGSQ